MFTNTYKVAWSLDSLVIEIPEVGVPRGNQKMLFLYMQEFNGIACFILSLFFFFF